MGIKQDFMYVREKGLISLTYPAGPTNWNTAKQRFGYVEQG